MREKQKPGTDLSTWRTNRRVLVGRLRRHFYYFVTRISIQGCGTVVFRGSRLV